MASQAKKRPMGALFLSELIKLSQAQSMTRVYVHDGKFNGYWTYTFDGAIAPIRVMASILPGIQPSQSTLFIGPASDSTAGVRVRTLPRTILMPQMYNLGYFDDDTGPMDFSNNFNDTYMFMTLEDVAGYYRDTVTAVKKSRAPTVV